MRTPHASLALACALMLVLLVLNYAGIRTGARTQNLLSVVKIGMMVGLGVLAMAIAPAAAPGAVVPAAPLTSRLSAALIPCFYAYGGYHMTMNLGADVKDAKRRFPLAITGGVLLVVGLYLLLNAAYQRVLGTSGVAESKLVAAALSRAVFGPAGEAVISVAIFLSAAGFVNATILQMPRSFYAMAEDGVLPKVFLRVNPKTQVQEAGLLFFGVTMLVPAFLLGSFEKVLSYVIFTDALTLAVVASTLFVLRRRQSGAGGFAMPGYPLLPAFYLSCLLGVAAHVLITEPRLALMGLAILAMGWPLFRLGRKVMGVPAGPGTESP